MNLVLGIDAGGTQTRAWLAQLDGTIIARGGAGGANVHALGVDLSRRAIVDAVAQAWRAAALPGDRARGFSAVFAGVAGAGTVEVQSALAAALAAEFGVAPAVCVVDHDLRVALSGALVGGPGAVLVAGTGSACFGRAADGRTWKAGGWGPVLDDGGSGHWLGVQSMRAIVRAADGRMEKTPLAEAVMTKLGVLAPRALLALVRDPAAGGLDRAAIAALAPLVLSAAAGGDAVAVEIAMRGAHELAAMAGAVWSALGFDGDATSRLAGVGGLLEHHAYYRDLVGCELAKRSARVQLERAELSPTAGAVLLALETAGVSVHDAVLARVRESAARTNVS